MYVAHERRAYLLRLLQQRGSIRSAELAEELGVTDETIRTDLVALQAQGLLQRVHGGARYILPQRGAEDAARLDCQLAELALPHLKPNMRVYLDPAPMAEALLIHLAERCPLTVLCPAPDTLRRLNTAALPHRLLSPAGEMDRASGLLLASAVEPIDMAILSPPALRPSGAQYPTAAQAAWAEAASAAAAQTLILIPAAAMLNAAPYTATLTCPLLLTENAVPDALAAMPHETVPYISAADLEQENY